MIYQQLSNRFKNRDRPDWYSEAVDYLRGGKDSGLFGLYLYYSIKEKKEITNIINIGTARGHSAVCAAKGLKSANRSGEIHTIDIIHPDEPMVWDSDSASDPVAGNKISMRELINKFHNESDVEVPIKFHVGKSQKILSEIDITPDLVFHDGLHTYEAVSSDIELISQNTNKNVTHIFDDCYLLNSDLNYRPFSSNFFKYIDRKIGLPSIVREIRKINIYKENAYPGVTMAVEELIESNEFSKLEIIQDKDHAPMIGIFDVSH